MSQNIGFNDEITMNLISAIRQETWRKRRAELHFFSNYFNEKKLELLDILYKIANVILANCLTWREKQEEKSKFEELRKIRTHVGVALSMLSECRDVGQSPIVQSMAKRMNLDRTQRRKYWSIWNLNQLFTYFTNKQVVDEKEIMRKSMALLVAFSEGDDD
ncbi:MAG: hypothetical protein EZS28_039516 [Streblomastix strix]|uniref:Uncharacterized protein n=1 Tax=Streblomastix strix TaxID=222440 RepID=A0A5J4U2H8_9EUKA|nr:MAG: hypothetical protein EZS28_039516 [Streblomastix strix]